MASAMRRGNAGMRHVLFRLRFLQLLRAVWLGFWLAIACSVAAVAAGDTPLDRAVDTARRLVAPAGMTVLAADASPEGHWSFVNAKAERFTASNADEMARMPGVLAPEVAGDASRLLLVVTARSLFAPGPALRLLPSAAQWRLATDGGVYRLGRTPPYRVSAQ